MTLWYKIKNLVQRTRDEKSVLPRNKIFSVSFGEFEFKIGPVGSPHSFSLLTELLHQFYHPKTWCIMSVAVRSVVQWWCRTCIFERYFRSVASILNRKKIKKSCTRVTEYALKILAEMSKEELILLDGHIDQDVEGLYDVDLGFDGNRESEPNRPSERRFFLRTEPLNPNRFPYFRKSRIRKVKNGGEYLTRKL